MSGGVPAGERRDLSHHEQIQDAQSQCLPCKLCGGKAIIRDAGIGAGYYITCENGGTFRSADGCLISDRRLGGWAYNVMEWWNRLMATPTPPIEGRDADVEREAGKIATQVADRCQGKRKPGQAPQRYAIIWQAARLGAIAALQALGERG